MKRTTLCLVMLAVVFSATGCEFRPFDPTGAIEACPSPQAVPTSQVTPPSQNPPSLRITPEEVQPGDEIAVFGSGFTADGSVVVFIKSQEGFTLASEFTADAEGFIAGSVPALPSHISSGEWSVVAIDVAGNVAAEQSFNVIPVEPVEDGIQFSALGVIPGGSLEFSAGGFAPKEPLSVRIVRPDQSEVAYDAEADDHGVLAGNVLVDEGRPLGVYLLTVVGKSHLHTALGWFLVYFPAIILPEQEFEREYECQEFPIYLGDLVDAPIDEILFLSIHPASLATVRLDGNMIYIHCNRNGHGTIIVKFVPMWTGLGQKVEVWAAIPVECK